MTYPFVQARWFTPTVARVVDLVVVHTMEVDETSRAAELVAAYFATRPATAKASAHYMVDDDTIVQGVAEKDVAYAAPGANHNGIHVELAGRAGQTAGDWADAYSVRLLAKAAPLVAGICHRHAIPPGYVDAQELRAGRRGITTHLQVSTAFGLSDHWDPGPNFPMGQFLDAVTRNLGGPVPDEQTIHVNAPVVAVLTHPAWPAGAYMQICADGGTFGFGGAPFIGSAAGAQLAKPISGAALTPSGKGLVLVAADGGIFAYGDATFKGRVLFG